MGRNPLSPIRRQAGEKDPAVEAYELVRKSAQATRIGYESLSEWLGLLAGPRLSQFPCHRLDVPGTWLTTLPAMRPVSGCVCCRLCHLSGLHLSLLWLRLLQDWGEGWRRLRP